MMTTEKDEHDVRIEMMLKTYLSKEETRCYLSVLNGLEYTNFEFVNWIIRKNRIKSQLI